MLRIFSNVVVAIVLIAALAILVVFGLPLLSGMQVYAVLTESMAPTYPTGSLVMVEPASPEEIAEGDVITFHMDGFESPVTHRVLRVDAAARQFETKGDNNRGADIAPVPFDSLEGRVRFGVPHLGTLAIRLRSPGGMLAALWVFLALVVVVMLPDMASWRGARRRERAELQLLQNKIVHQQQQMQERLHDARKE